MDAWGYMVMTLYAVSGATIVLGAYVAFTGRIPRTVWRKAAGQPRTQTRAQGSGMVLIGGLLLLSTVAVDLGSHSLVRPYWVLLVWVALLGALLGIRYMTGRSQRATS
jgi:hypothetical protein